MKKMTLTAATLAVFAAPAFAASIVEELDADGSGGLSMTEIQLAYPDITAETFPLIDLNGDGEVDVNEAAAAQDAGLLVTSG